MLSHLIEIRRRILLVSILFGCLFLLFFFIAPHLFHGLIWPLLKALPHNKGLVATQITTPLFTPLNIAADMALLGTTPYVLFHIGRFASPGLYQHERYHLSWVLCGSFTLFILGCIFCYYLVLPFMFQFIVNMMPQGVHLMPDMGFAIDFITRMLLIFGLCFQVPLVALILVRLQLISILTLKNMRPYVIVGAFTLGMLLTPPDVLSQIMLAIPLCLLYEFSVITARYAVKLDN
ncbi:MAG: twin-arginine translocase subunit TatC [Legionellaceae bacterium]|nr:twin-arginine translocase subunit TatC [Legionellaceae bacterium]